MNAATSVLRTALNRATGARHKMFCCPGCDMLHSVNVGDCHEPGRPVWRWNGSDDQPTFEPSILVTIPRPDGESICHSFVRNGQIQFLGDCTHALAGQTVPLPAWCD